jgi:transposase
MRVICWSNDEIVEAFTVSDQTIRTVRQRYEQRGVEAVLTDKRQERRRQALTDGQAAHLLAITCSKVPDGHNHLSMNGWARPTCLCSSNRWLVCAVCK